MASALAASADRIRIDLEDPVLVDRSPAGLIEWGGWRMPKVYWCDDHELYLTYQTGRDHYCDQGITTPLFTSRDRGTSWTRGEWPSPLLSGLNPVLTRIQDGELFGLMANQGIELDMRRMPAPVGSFPGYAGFSLYRLDQGPQQVIDWFTDMRGVRWSPRTKAWSSERIAWDNRGQVVWVYNDAPQSIAGHWSQKLFFERPALVLGDELLYADYHTQRMDAEGRVPAGFECHLLASADRGRSWSVRSRMAEVPKGDGTGEPVLAIARDGELVAVIRRDFGEPRPMWIIRSRDHGRSWSKPVELFNNGVMPCLVQLENGLLVLVFGRPGVALSASSDGGRTWSEPSWVHGDDSRGYSTCGNISMVATGPDQVLVAYNNVLARTATGEACKTIQTRRVTITCGARS